MKSIAFKTILSAAAILLGMSTLGFAQPEHALTVNFDLFKNPPGEFRGTRWFTLAMGSMTEEAVKNQINSIPAGAYGQWMATPDGRGADPNGVSYLNEEFFRVYRIAIEEGLKKGIPLRVLYDEQQFPTGSAGGLFKAKYPDLIGRSLEKAEQNFTGPTKVSLAAPIENGTYIGAVMMNTETLELVDVSTSRTGEKDAIECQVPKGNWKVMLFYLDPNANRRGLVDYLDPKAVDGLIDVMYQKYYDHLKDYFGTVIKLTFYDEPGLQHPEFRGRAWTARFNDDFQKKFGYSPMKWYPAIWYDIGPDTAAARNALYGFRADMYADNFIGRIAKWCADHGVKMGGHLDQEEAINQVSVQGDLMKVFKHQQIPAHDDIWWSGRSTVSYKIMTSSAFNWDKPIIMAETYAAYREQNEKVAYRTAMDQHTFGVNFQVGNYPRGTNEAQFGEYLGRLQYLLQHGRHVADVGILYPIASMQSAYRFVVPPKVSSRNADANFYYALEGGIPPAEMDYQQVGEMLFRGYHVDYTWLHPEIIESNCLVQGNRLILNNKENREEYRVIVIPGGDTINLGVAKKIQEFYNAGGAVIATSKLPTKSAEFGKDKEVQQIMDAIFGLPEREPITADIRSNTDEFKIWWSHPNSNGGQAYFLPRLDTTAMTDALQQCDVIRDVDVKQPPSWPLKSLHDYDGALTYIHKAKDGHDIYFFANSFDTGVDTSVVIRGKKNLSIWNPHTGEKTPLEATYSVASLQPPGPPAAGGLGGARGRGRGGPAAGAAPAPAPTIALEPGKSEETTTVRLVLDPVKSVFYVSEQDDARRDARI